MRTRRVKADELDIDLAPEVREKLGRLEGDPSALAEVGDRKEDANYRPSS